MSSVSCSPQIRQECVLSESNCVPTTWDVKTTSTSTGTTSSVGHLQPAPVLQAQDGTFVGSAINIGDWTTINLAGFNQDGTVKWLEPSNHQALLTTSDGGVAASSSGQYVSFDQAGNMPGQFASLPMLSWTQAYQNSAGSLDNVTSPNISLAATFAAVRGPSWLIPTSRHRQTHRHRYRKMSSNRGVRSAWHRIFVFHLRNCHLVSCGSCAGQNPLAETVRVRDFDRWGRTLEFIGARAGNLPRFLGSAISSSGYPRQHVSFERTIEGIVVLLWSLILIVFPRKKLLTGLRGRAASPRVSDGG